MQKNQVRHTILMIEADPVEIELARTAAAACDVDFSLVLLDDADAVLAWLNDSVIRDRPMPRAILMDLRLPKLDGLATLRKLRKHAATSDIPVLAFSAEFTQADVLMSYQVGVNIFVAKPTDLQHFIKLLNEQIPYWLQPRQSKLDLAAK